MERYNKYKNSGIEWIGEIPEDWEVKKLSYCFNNIGSGTTPTSGKTEYYENGKFKWLQTGDLMDNEIFFTSKKITQEALNQFSTLRFYPIGSIVIAMYGATIVKTVLLKIETTTNQACCVLAEPKNILSKYVFYWFNSIKKHVISLSYGGGQPNINQELIRSLRIQLPPTTEQTTIANYLDRKTAEIDELITQKERLLKLYEEEKTAIINQAVTKGINPDVKLKDSGIDWLWEIPEHWEVKKLKYVVSLITEKNSEDLQKVALENIESKSGQYIKSNSEFEGEGIHFKIGDILYGKLRPYLAKVFLADFEGAAVGDFFVLRPKINCLTAFIKYRLLSTSFTEISNSSTYGAKMPRVSWEFMTHLLFAWPSKNEQYLIVKYIETETIRINAKAEKTKRLIELLKEYKTALISEVVTGKIKVIDN